MQDTHVYEVGNESLRLLLTATKGRRELRVRGALSASQPTTQNNAPRQESLVARSIPK